MEKLPKYTHANGIDYVLAGDYYIPMLALPEESRPIGRWGRMHQNYLKEFRPGYYSSLLLSGKLWTYLADLNEQAQDRLDTVTAQMMAAEEFHPQPGGRNHPARNDLCIRRLP